MAPITQSATRTCIATYRSSISYKATGSSSASMIPGVRRFPEGNRRQASIPACYSLRGLRARSGRRLKARTATGFATSKHGGTENERVYPFFGRTIPPNPGGRGGIAPDCAPLGPNAPNPELKAEDGERYLPSHSHVTVGANPP